MQRILKANDGSLFAYSSRGLECYMHTKICRRGKAEDQERGNLPEWNMSGLRPTRVRDGSTKTVCGVGYLGLHDKSDPHHKMLTKVWHHMLSRCYWPNDNMYEAYGARGVYVCDRWLCYANFQKDSKQLPGWEDKVASPKDYSIDKDARKAALYYAPDTCMWASREVQMANRENTSPFSAVSPEGEIHLFPSISTAARVIGVSTGTVFNALQGASLKSSEWFSFLPLSPDPGYVYTYFRVPQR